MPWLLWVAILVLLCVGCGFGQSEKAVPWDQAPGKGKRLKVRVIKAVMKGTGHEQTKA